MTEFLDFPPPGDKSGTSLILATIGSVTSAGATLTLDGSASTTTKRYKHVLTGEALAAGDRVLVARMSGTFLIIGKIGLTGGSGGDSDSGWTDLTVESSFATYDDSAASIPKYRKIGSAVYLHGVVTPASALAGSGDLVLICTLPSGARPSQILRYVCQGSGINRWQLSVYPAGGVYFSRYGAAALAEAAAGAWLPFDAVFAV